MNKYTDRNLKILINEMNCLWGGIFITGGGSITLIFTNFSYIKLLLCILGIILCFCFTMSYFDKRMECEQLVKYLNDKEIKS